MFSGSIVALVTPFKEGKVDFDALAELVDFHVQAGTDAIVPCGTTGESPTLSHQEHDRVIEEVIRAADRRVPVIAGTGSNSTDEAIRLTRHAAEAGADGALLVCPYYNKPSQEGLYQHFAKLAEICARNNMLWSAEAEEYLLSHCPSVNTNSRIPRKET